MKPLFFTSVLLPLLFVLLCVAIPQPAVATPKTIRVEEIQPGMKGYGLTVFQGTVPERFEVEVVDVVPNFLLRQNIILIRCSHPVTDKAGVIGGMSGSPIFINGRLAGALAYGWRFSKEALAGVTPIANMFDITHRPQRGSTIRNPVEKVAIFQNHGTSLQQELTDTFFRRFQTDTGTSLLPARTPLSLSGFSGASYQMIQDALSPFGMEPMLGGGSGDATLGPDRFEDGGAIGVQMIRGDLSATGIGTVTTTYNGQVLAFGHPMFNMGEGYLPVTTARIHTVIASYERSNKLGTPLQELGALVQDRPAGISARTDLRAGMIPVTFRIADRRNKFSETYHISVANRQWLTGRLIHSALVQFVDHACSDATDVSARIDGRIKVAGRPLVRIQDMGVSRQGLGALVSWFRPAQVVSGILANPFEDAQIESIEFDVELEYSLSFSYIKGIYLTSENPLPGEVVNLHVRLMDFGGAEKIVTVPIEIPAGVEGQKLKLNVGGGSEVEPRLPAPESLDDVLSNIQRYYPADALVVTIEVPTPSLTVRGELLTDLPSSAASALQSDMGDDESKGFTTQRVQVVPMNRIVSGTHSIQIKAGKRTSQ